MNIVLALEASKTFTKGARTPRIYWRYLFYFVKTTRATCKRVHDIIGVLRAQSSDVLTAYNIFVGYHVCQANLSHEAKHCAVMLGNIMPGSSQSGFG